MLKAVVLLTFVALVQSHDVKVGNNTEGRKIYNEVHHASPAIWKQTDTITIKADDAEVISRVVITDLRPDKAGDVKIIEGGEGDKNVTIELKSPTVLRGYDFQVEVYAIPENDQNKDKGKDIPVPGQVRHQRNPEEFLKSDKPNLYSPEATFEDGLEVNSTTEDTKLIVNDTKINEDKTKSVDINSEKVNDDQLTSTSETNAAKETKNKETANPNNNGEVADSINHDHSRQSRDATSETPNKGSEVNKPKYSTVRPLHDNGFVIHPGTDNSNYSSDDLFANASTPQNSNDQDNKRNVREDKTQLPAFSGDQKTNDDPKILLSSTTAKSVAVGSIGQQQRNNVSFQKLPTDSASYPVQGTNTAPTTENSQNKRQTDLKSTETTQQEDKFDHVKNVPRFLGVQTTTVSQ